MKQLIIEVSGVGGRKEYATVEEYTLNSIKGCSFEDMENNFAKLITVLTKNEQLTMSDVNFVVGNELMEECTKLIEVQ